MENNTCRCGVNGVNMLEQILLPQASFWMHALQKGLHAWLPPQNAPESVVVLGVVS